MDIQVHIRIDYINKKIQIYYLLIFIKMNQIIFQEF